jgi:polyphenol oxidase
VAEEVIRFHFPEVSRVQIAFTTRRGGVSKSPFAAANLSFDVGDAQEDVLANRLLLSDELGVSAWQELRQVHGTALHFDAPPAGAGERARFEGDGLATARPGQALVIKTADCQAILLAHKSGSHIAALHCGWRGNLAGFPLSGVERFCSRYGLSPADLMAVRGPSLGSRHAQFINFEREWGSGFARYFDPRQQTMDLWQLTTDQLLAAGLRRKCIFSIDLCTYEREDLFFSYRREKSCGRQAAIIWMEEGLKA